MKNSKQNSELYIWGNQCDGWHLVKTNELSIIHECMPPNTHEVRHYHRYSRQFFFVLSGTAVLEVDGNRITINQHEGCEVPPLVPHQLFNESSKDVEFIVTSQPNSKEDRVLVD